VSEEKRYDVFLSHNSDDKPLVEELALRLQDEAGLNPWLDAWHIPGGAQWEQEIDQALGSCRTCAVILGEHGWMSCLTSLRRPNGLTSAKDWTIRMRWRDWLLRFEEKCLIRRAGRAFHT